MTTTIQIDDTTHQILREIKEKSKAKSYDEVIKNIVSGMANIPESMFGAHPDMKKFSRKDRAELHEL
ncbi:MAG: hypothetical protein WC974_04265 [Thermoplasmata archaeon]